MKIIKNLRSLPGDSLRVIRRTPPLVFAMALSSYRMHRIYLAATMDYGLGSDDPEELAYYKKLRKEIDDMKKDSVKKGIPLTWDIPDGMDQ